MAFMQKTPPIRLFVSVEQFNLLMELISLQTTLEDERLKDRAVKLKEKILKYSVPYENDEGISMVDIRFFPNEAEFIMYTLLNNVVDTELGTNYYDVLLKVKESLKEKYENE